MRGWAGLGWSPAGLRWAARQGREGDSTPALPYCRARVFVLERNLVIGGDGQGTLCDISFPFRPASCSIYRAATVRVAMLSPNVTGADLFCCCIKTLPPRAGRAVRLGRGSVSVLADLRATKSHLVLEVQVTSDCGPGVTWLRETVSDFLGRRHRGVWSEGRHGFAATVSPST